MVRFIRLKILFTFRLVIQEQFLLAFLLLGAGVWHFDQVLLGEGEEMVA